MVNKLPINRLFEEKNVVDVFRACMIRGAELVGLYEFPAIKAGDKIPNQVSLTDKLRTSHAAISLDPKMAINIWNRPNDMVRIKALQGYESVVAPIVMFQKAEPKAKKLCATAVSRYCSYHLQNLGVNVIPNVQIGDKHSRGFILDGIGCGGVIAVSCEKIANLKDKDVIIADLRMIIDRLAPTAIVVNSLMPHDAFDFCSGLNVPIIQVNGLNENETGSHNFLRFPHIENAELVGEYGIPRLKPFYGTVDKGIPFHKIHTTTNHEQLVHFFIHDRQFMTVANNFEKHVPKLKPFYVVATPDFSVYRDMPFWQQIWSIFQSRYIGYMLQRCDISVIPNIRFAVQDTYDICLDGIEKGSTVLTSSYGCKGGKENKVFFVQGLKRMVETLEPQTIINYSSPASDIFAPYREMGINIIEIEDYVSSVRKAAI